MTPNEQRLENSRNNLRKIVEGGQIVIEADACMHEAFNKFISNIVPFLDIYNRKLVMFNATFDKLCEYMKSKDKNIVEKTKRAIESIIRLENADIIRIMELLDGETIVSKLQSLQGKVNMTLITQNKNEARMIINGNTAQSKIEVRQINKFGFLSPHIMKSENQSQTSAEEYVMSENEVPFHVVDDNHMYKGTFNCFRSEYEYKENDVVCSDGRRLVLDKKIAEGGEGTVFSIVGLPDMLVKIFNDKKVDSAERSFYSRRKVELLLESNIRQRPDICFPVAKVTDKNGNYIGYIMPKADGISMNELLIGSQTTIKEYFGENTNRKQTVELCIAFLKAVKFLHDNGIVIGDIRPENIIVKNSTEISIIDTDSFQLNEFTCPVGIPLYTAPERITDDFKMINKSTFIKKKSDDCFAVATILFQILMPAKEPYSKSDSAEEDLEAIKKGIFAYPHPTMSQKLTTAKAPKGNWRFCWSHVYRDVRIMLYETFMKGSEHYLPENRYTINDWLKAFKLYYKKITSGEITRFDPMSLDLIPIRFIKSRRLEYGKCKNPDCKLDIVSTLDLERYHGYCYKCAHVTQASTCPVCKQNDVVYKMIDFLENKPKPDKCFECRQKELSAVYETRKCSDCGKVFEITVREKERFESRGYHLPKRCKDCRSEVRGTSNTSAYNPKNNNANSSSAKEEQTTTSFYQMIYKNLGFI